MCLSIVNKNKTNIQEKQMKILIVNKFLHPNGGSETYIFKLGEALIKNGHEVQYFGMDVLAIALMHILLIWIFMVVIH